MNLRRKSRAKLRLLDWWRVGGAPDPTTPVLLGVRRMGECRAPSPALSSPHNLPCLSSLPAPPPLPPPSLSALPCSAPARSLSLCERRAAPPSPASSDSGAFSRGSSPDLTRTSLSPDPPRAPQPAPALCRTLSPPRNSYSAARLAAGPPLQSPTLVLDVTRAGRCRPRPGPAVTVGGAGRTGLLVSTVSCPALQPRPAMGCRSLARPPAKPGRASLARSLTTTALSRPAVTVNGQWLG